MLTILTFSHRLQLLDGDQWKPWVTKWLDHPVLVECEPDGLHPIITVINWDQVKDQLPKRFFPISVKSVPE